MKNSLYMHVLGLAMVLMLVVPASAATTRPAHNPKIWTKAIDAFEAADRKKMPPVGGVEFFGSSTIRIWNVQKAFPGEPVFNRGFGGSWSSDCAYYAKRMVIAYKPRTVIFYAGDNDIAGGASGGEVIKSFKAFVKEVHAALPRTEIVFISIKPSPSRFQFWPTMKKTNAAIRKYAQATPGVSYVDIASEMFHSDGSPRKELFRSDELHMNAKGYAIANRKVAPYVQSNTDNQKF